MTKNSGDDKNMVRDTSSLLCSVWTPQTCLVLLFVSFSLCSYQDSASSPQPNPPDPSSQSNSNCSVTNKCQQWPESSRTNHAPLFQQTLKCTCVNGMFSFLPNVSDSLNQPPIQLSCALFPEITVEYVLTLFMYQRRVKSASVFRKLVQAPGY